MADQHMTFEIENVPIGKKKRAPKHKTDIQDANAALVEERQNPQQTRHAIVTRIVRSRLDDYTACEEETRIRRILRRMKIMERERR